MAGFSLEASTVVKVKFIKYRCIGKFIKYICQGKFIKYTCKGKFIKYRCQGKFIKYICQGKFIKYSCKCLRVKNLLNSSHFKKHFMFLAAANLNG